MQSEMYKKIVIATDGSENAKNAALSAIEIARIAGAKIYALNALPDIPHLSYFGVPIEPSKGVSPVEKDFEINLETDGKKALDVVVEMGKKAGVEVEAVMVKGHPGSAIINFAEKNDIDLIVMGTLGRSGIDRVLVGSVAVDVARHAKTRVMIVK
ncbi:universal stress protein UspA-like protein [Methanomethylovorans hollandica DSM 15978]|uniref:Universal stress protein UspA-like protein n=1 Tax=Methanomethylovorans hollandica (strain DSM 15978 / NBRC 107637 / DMS1) TaxID=867904 RepID=L0KX48_METHD|nr:universal stress protein [Methanomethylovorans hollandica]AGB48549.1 universal stress protein UspA-like protein [Methanomethylovorans hollandica DSM 15978]